MINSGKVINTNCIISILFQRADTAEAILKAMYFLVWWSPSFQNYSTVTNVNYLSAVISMESFAQLVDSKSGLVFTGFTCCLNVRGFQKCGINFRYAAGSGWL